MTINKNCNKTYLKLWAFCISLLHLKNNLIKFDVQKSVHHHMIQINQPTRCNSFTSLLLDIYVWLNTFRAPLRPSSGAYNYSRSLWFYRWSVAVGELLVVVWHVNGKNSCECVCFVLLSYLVNVFLCVLCCLMFIDMLHIQMQLMHGLHPWNEYVCMYVCINIQHHSIVVYTIQKHIMLTVISLTNKNYSFCINSPKICSNVFYIQIQMTCFGSCLECKTKTECIIPLFIHTI
jgi:hypothetical protein